jgi:alpha-tubulin suppressor-like RCC1 family protein
LRPITRLGLSILVPGLLSCSGNDATGPNPHPQPSPNRLALGSRHVCAVRAVDLACWGRGTEGQLGIGVTPVDTTPAVIAGAPELISLVSGPTHTCGLEATRVAWCWGSNTYGELGSSNTDQQCGATVCQMSPVAAADGMLFSELAAGLDFTCGLTIVGTVYCWGLNDTGQLGNASTGADCGGLRCSLAPVVAAQGKTFLTITAGQSHICGLDKKGVAWCWGYEALPIPGGHPNPSFLPNPRKVTGAPPFNRIKAGGYHTCALTESGEAWCWGIDALGAGSSKLESAKPVPVSGGHRFEELAAARFSSCGRTASGQVFCWGPNPDGEIGNLPVGSTSRFDVPTIIQGAMVFQTVAGGGSTYCGVTDQGQTACWGRGIEGQLGSGHVSSTAPVLVP